MVLYPRDLAKLRPAKGPVVHVERHPGIVVHCTGGQRPETLEHALVRWRVAQRYHQDARGWSDVGYHFAVSPFGDIIEGRGWGVRGAHAVGYNRWLGVVLFGKGGEMAAAEKVGILTLLDEALQRGHGQLVIPHNAVSKKSCPGPAPTAWIRQQWPENPGGVAA